MRSSRRNLAVPMHVDALLTFMLLIVAERKNVLHTAKLGRYNLRVAFWQFLRADGMLFTLNSLMHLRKAYYGHEASRQYFDCQKLPALTKKLPNA